MDATAVNSYVTQRERVASLLARGGRVSRLTGFFE